MMCMMVMMVVMEMMVMNDNDEEDDFRDQRTWMIVIPQRGGNSDGDVHDGDDD